MKERISHYVYMMTNKPGGVLYIGITDDIVKRTTEHRTGKGGRFTGKYNLDRLVYIEPHSSAQSAMLRECRMKAWKREWKVELLEKENPTWRDLYNETVESFSGSLLSQGVGE